MPFQLKETNFGNFGVCPLAENNLPAAGRFVRNFVTKSWNGTSRLVLPGDGGVKKIVGSGGTDLPFEWFGEK